MGKEPGIQPGVAVRLPIITSAQVTTLLGYTWRAPPPATRRRNTCGMMIGHAPSPGLPDRHEHFRRRRGVVLATVLPVASDRTVCETFAAALTDEEWSLIEPHLPLGERGPIPDLRRQFTAVMWRFRAGSPWRDLPAAEYGPWSTVYDRFRLDEQTTVDGRAVRSRGSHGRPPHPGHGDMISGSCSRRPPGCPPR
ncbi:transposase [Nonomuraea sp. NPDC049784]|uniref:transposase n=1 Tax=Nonomuraea sp. NPDC049784 TaxID=3154361 RepID=UPI00340D15C5